MKLFSLLTIGLYIEKIFNPSLNYDQIINKQFDQTIHKQFDQTIHKQFDQLLIKDKNNKFYEFDNKIDELLKSSNLFIYFENKITNTDTDTGVFAEANLHNLINNKIISKLDDKWTYGIDNELFKNMNLINLFNEKKILPLDLYKEQLYPYFDINTLYFLYDNNIPLKFINTPFNILSHIKHYIDNDKIVYKSSYETIFNNIKILLEVESNKKVFLSLDLSYLSDRKILKLLDQLNIDYVDLSIYDYTMYKLIYLDKDMIDYI
jgi:hypothetical protein